MNDIYTELYGKLSRLQWLIQRHNMLIYEQQGPLIDTTRGQGRVLAALKIQPKISTKDLSYLLGIGIPSLNEVLNKLEKGGYVSRKPSESDKRVTMNHLTDKGKATKQIRNDYGDIFNCLTEDEQKVFGEHLDRVIGTMEEQIGTTPDPDEWNLWMKNARDRMGEKRFERFMLLRQNGGFGGSPMQNNTENEERNK